MVGISHLTLQQYEEPSWKETPRSGELGLLRANQNGWPSEKSLPDARRFVGDSLLAEVGTLCPLRLRGPCEIPGDKTLEGPSRFPSNHSQGRAGEGRPIFPAVMLHGGNHTAMVISSCMPRRGRRDYRCNDL